MFDVDKLYAFILKFMGGLLPLFKVFVKKDN